jgi:hypothetical protein
MKGEAIWGIRCNAMLNDEIKETCEWYLPRRNQKQFGLSPAK